MQTVLTQIRLLLQEQTDLGLHCLSKRCLKHFRAGPHTQSVTCLAADVCLTADPGVASLIPAQYHIFVEIDHEIKQKYVHELLGNCLFKPA